MKKRLLILASLCALFSFNLSAQTFPFSIEWVNIGSGSSSYGIQKNIVGDAAGTGLETAAGSFGTLGTIELYAYSNYTNAASVNDLISGQAWGRYRAIVAVPNFTGIGSYEPTEYAQHIIEPTNGKFLRITTISMVALGGGTSDMKMLAMYAVKTGNDLPAASDFKPMSTAANYFNAIGDPVSYEAKDAATAISLVASNAVPNTQAKRTITFSGLLINVDAGQKAYFRFYPYLAVTTASARYLFLRNTIFSGVTSAVTLPLNFLSFTAKPDQLGKAVNLVWKTAQEVNTKNFEIERRGDKTGFVNIGAVDSKNTGGTHTYEFTDKNPLSGTGYYRIKQVDLDGAYTYSEISDAKFKQTINLTLYPNPVTDQLNVDHGYTEKGGVLKVLALDGKTVSQGTINSGTSATAINVSALAAGTYILTCELADQKISKKFIKK